MRPKKQSRCGSFSLLGIAEEQQYLECGHRTERLEAEQVGQLAREGHQVVQFKNVGTKRFVAVAVDGEATVYGGGHGARKQ